MNKRQMVLWVLVSVGLSACAGSSDRPDSGKGSARQTAEINTSLGREYMGRQQYEVALDKLKKAIAADPTYAPGQTLIGILYEQLGELDLAESHYHKAVEAAPGNGDVNNNYGVFLCGTGQAVKAERYFLQAVKDPFYSTPEVAFANAGSCMLEEGNLDKAEKYLRQSLDYDNKFPDALLAMAGLEYQNTDYMGARAFLQRFESTGTETAQSLWLGMRIETRLDDRRSARGYEARLLSRFPNSPQAERAKGLNPDD